MRYLALAVLAALVVSLPAAETLAYLPDADVLDRARTLAIEERRQLVYLYARLNKPKVAEGLAAQILAENPRDRQTLLVLASMYLEQKDAAATLRLARQYLGFFPGDHQGLYFLGAGHYLAKQYAEANRVLRDLKLTQFSRGKYPYETDLAASAYAAGDWHRAMLSYQELLRHHALGDELRDEVRRVLDGLYREHLPRIEATVAETRLDRARVWRYTAANAQHLSDRHWLSEQYSRDEVALAAAPGLRSARADRAEAAAMLTTTYDRRWRTDVWAGASREGLLAGGRVQVTFARERTLTVEVAYQERSTDSLAVEALDGRQNRAGLGLNWLIESDLSFAGRLHARELYIGGTRIGRGKGVDFSLDQTLWRQGPRVVAGYRGSVGSFAYASIGSLPSAIAEPIADPAGGPAAADAVIAGLVSRRINRHGAGLLITDNLADAWHYRFTAGADYDFVLESTGWNAGLGFTFWPRKSIELSAEAAYTSSAGASNAGSSATLLTFFVRTYY